MIDRNYRYLGACVLLAASMAVAGPALSADIHQPGGMKDMGEAEPMGGVWTGFYLGGHAGFARGSFKATEVDPVFAVLIDEELDHEPSGGVFGVQAGYNWQRARWVFGIEGDVAATNVEGDLQYDFDVTTVGVDTFTSSETTELKYLATLRARIGVDIGPAMLYATGGLALGKVDSFFSTTVVGAGLLPDGTASGDDSVTHVGYAVGGGVEAWLRQDVSIKAEYLYADLGEEVHQPVASVPGEPFDLDMHLVRFGLNYHF
jgi:opacity protein-like surface antigen